MNTQLPCRQARQTLNAIRQIRFKSTVAKAKANASDEGVVKRKNNKEEKPNYLTYGSKIWVFEHLQRHHMVYSLTKSMRNNFSLRQLPFNGKKTVPPALRKDLWHPFCNISFHPAATNPSTATAIGLSCFQKLREFRHRHELEWTQADYSDPKTGEFVGRDKIPKLLCDQKANSVADMAFVFEQLGLKNVVEGEEEANIGLVGARSGAGVRIEWWDLRDAEFAQTWSDNVEHVAMGQTLQTNNRIEGKLWGRGKRAAEEQGLEDFVEQEVKEEQTVAA